MSRGRDTRREYYDDDPDRPIVIGDDPLAAVLAGMIGYALLAFVVVAAYMLGEGGPPDG